MIIRSISGNDNISKVMTQAMGVTINTLYSEKLLTLEQATNFMDTHVCLMVNNGGPWSRVKKFLNWKTDGSDDDNMYSLVVKITQLPDNPNG